jgi:hypothetical protein
MSKRNLTFLVFSFFFIINIASSGGHFDANDGVEYFLVTESMVMKHSAKLYPDIPDIQKLYFNIRNSINVNTIFQTGKAYQGSVLKPTYIEHCCLLSAIAVPFYYAAAIFSVSPISVVALFVNSLIIALTSVIIFCFSLEIYASKKIAFILSLIFSTCSFVWPYNTTLFPQPLQALCMIGSAYFIYISAKRNNNNNRRIYFAGLGALFLGLSIFAQPTSAIVLPGLILYGIFMMKDNKKSLSSFVITIVIILFFAGLVNYWRFGSFTDFGYGNFGSLSIHHGWKGLLGLLASSGFGLVFFFPIVVLLPLSLKYMYKENKGLFILSTYIILVNWLYFGTLSVPMYDPGTWNGFAWGPRYLIVILPFVMIVSGTLFQRVKELHVTKRLFLKLLLIVLAAAGFCINLLGTLVWYMYGYSYGWEREVLWKYEQGKTKINSYDIMTWNPYYSPIILDMKALMSGYLVHIQPTHDYRSNGLAPCPYDIYVFCKLGTMPMSLFFANIVILAILIVMEVSNFNPKFFLVQLKNHYMAKKNK